MTKITIGMPVYNGGELFHRSVDCLLRQTERDFLVLIFDNCSDDGTGEYADEIALKDARFMVHHQPENVGAKENFKMALAAAETEYFLWRAADDTSSDNYLELLLGALESNPEMGLAVPTMVTIEPDGERVFRPYPRLAGKTGWARRKAMVWRSPSSWFYGMYRTNEVKVAYHAVLNGFPWIWALDYLLLFQFGISDRMILVKEALFEQTHGHGSAAYIPATRAEQIAMLRTFYSFCRDFAEAHEPCRSVFFKLRRSFFLFMFAQRRTFRLDKIFLRRH